ncbi:MAG: FKBP-type peptidyl-prolyl cis-trans isomerase [Nitrospiraceae bacterium]|nr:MAG: FKBP-type peptidyl-prolyl cis-trans isomerase [Nitrospiraceae bacterium]
MKHIFIIVLNFIMLIGISSAGENLELEDEKIRFSYSIGYQVGGDFLRQGKDINPDVLLKGVLDALADKEPLMKRKEMNITLVNFQKTVAKAQKQKMIEKAKKNLEAGMAFLADNGKKEGVKILPSGLQYKVIREGAGKAPGLSDKVTVHYQGNLIDGTLFDSSFRRNKPATFSVNGVIKGWTEALQMMKVGAKWQLFIPPALAYGDKRTGSIEPNSTLIFDVELLSVQSSNAEETK